MVEEFIDAALEEIYQALKHGECVSLRNFGTFYVREERSSWVGRGRPARQQRHFARRVALDELFWPKPAGL